MPDREKAITGLKCLMTEDVQCDECPYVRSDYCIESIARDALALLLEQEPVKPIPTGIEPNYNCGACGLPITQGYPFCPWCGRNVKWKGETK